MFIGRECRYYLGTFRFGVVVINLMFFIVVKREKMIFGSWWFKFIMGVSFDIF